MTYLIPNTPLEDHLATHGLLVKREDLSCLPPGPPFSKTRGVLPHVQARFDQGVRLFGALDTSHSQAGHAVAQACAHVGATCWNFYPVYKGDEGEPVRLPQQRSEALGAKLFGLQAGRSAILFHQARKITESYGGYLMPNALKLPETVEETAQEVERTIVQATPQVIEQLGSLPWLVSASSGTIAAGVVRGLGGFRQPPKVIIHMGYSRSIDAVTNYIHTSATTVHWNSRRVKLEVIDEGYAYKDQARAGPDPEWPCNPWYDLKAFRWWKRVGQQQYGRAVMWNIG